MKTERIEVRMDEDILERIDGWRAGQAITRSEAIRRLADIGLSGGDGARALFELTRTTVLINAKSEGSLFNDAYAFAWHERVYPSRENMATLHRPHAESFDVSPAEMEQLTELLDTKSRDGEPMTFYNLEDYFDVRGGRSSWDRSKLLVATRYLYLCGEFDAATWGALLKRMEHPSEAQSVTSKFDPKHDIWS
jgi:hypothetical protein